MDRPLIRAIVFDLGGVVIPFDFHRGYAAMESLCPYPASEIPKRLRATGLVPLYETGKIESRDFVAQLTRALELQVTFEQFCDLWTAIFLPGTLLPESLFDDLGSRYPLIALSNTNELHFRQVELLYPVIRKFDHLVLSYRVGFAKPDPRIYAAAVAKASCGPEECLFVDDVESYVKGARAFGMNAIRFESASQLSEMFRRFGI